MDMKLSLPLIDALTNASGDDNNLPGELKQINTTTISQLKESLKRDLVNLFNSRECPQSPPAHLTQLRSSLLNYGLPDLTSVNLNSDRESLALCRAIENAIIHFEPRIRSAKVLVKGLPDPIEPEFYFRIEVVLNIALADELLVFDSALDPVTQTVEVEEVSEHE